MAVAATNQVVEHLRRLVRPPDAGRLTDGQLLQRFLSNPEEDAFAVLVQRHGRMVLGVCRRILKNAADADDAFQATFLVLVRKAASLLARPTVGDWLYGVAYHTALKSRAAILRRREKERQVVQMTAREPLTEALDLLDQELQHLPEKYRVPVVLCDLEARTHQEAAQLLGWPQGTVSGRLFRARELLARRLRRHGLALSAGSLAALLTEKAASAGVPTVLFQSTIQAAAVVAAGQAATAGIVSAPVAALTEGVLKAMLLHKIKFVAAVLLTLGILGTGAGVLTHRVLADKPGAPAEAEKPKEPGKAKPGEPSKDETTEVSAVLQSVDAAASTVTVGSKAFGPQTFTVSKDAKILLHDGTAGKLAFKEGKLDDLKAGFGVTLKLSGDGKSVVGIWVDGPTIRGTLKAVDATKRTVTVAITPIKNVVGQDQTYDVAREAKIVILDGKAVEKGQPAGPEKTLADLPVGSVVTLKLSAVEKAVGSIQAEGPEVSGVVKAVDKDKSTVTVRTKENEQTFAIPADLPITFGGGKDKRAPLAAHKLAELPVGALVVVKLTPDQKTVMSLRAEGANIDGTVKAVDAGKQQITVAVNAGKGEVSEEKTFTVPAEAGLQIDGKGAKLGDVPVGALVSLKLMPDQKSVLSLGAEGASISGTVKALDADKRKITIALGGKKGDNGEEKTFDLSADVTVRMLDDKAGRDAKLSDVPLTANVHLKLAVDQKTVRSLDVSGRAVSGTVKSVDAASGSVTLTEDGGERTLTLAKETPIVIDGKAGKLADLPVEALVGAKLAADQKTVLGLSAEGPTFKGTVKAVDAGKKSITVSVQVGKNEFAEKTFEVSKDVQVVTGINGVAVQFADVKADKEVIVRLSADRKGVLRVTLIAE